MKPQSQSLFKQLKNNILSLSQTEASITDEHSSVVPLCRCLEDLLGDGLTASSSFLTGPIENRYWAWIAILPRRCLDVPFSLSACISKISQCKKTLTDTGRGRLFIRAALNAGVFATTLNILRHNRSFLKECYATDSVLGDDISSEVLVSMTEILSKCRFVLSEKNSSFLDETWELPLYRTYELVPCKSLGIGLENLFGRLLVVDVEPGSVADEDAKIERGDIIDEIYGEVLRNATKRKFSSLLSDFQGAPIYISVVKFISIDGRVFLPSLRCVEVVGLCKHELIVDHRHRMAELKQQSDSQACAALESGQYYAKLCGHVGVGPTGTVDKIAGGVLEVLKQEKTSQCANTRDVLVELAEKDLTVKCRKTGNTLLQHAYPEIASCGRRIDYPLNFSYVAGDTTCTLSKSFICYVFEAEDTVQAKIILQSIAQGFKRTHWTV